MLKTIPTAELRVGMFLHQLSGSWMDHPFLRSRFLLRAERDVERVREAGIREAVIDTERGIDSAATSVSPATLEEPPSAPAAPPAEAVDTTGVGRHYLDAAKLCAKSMEAAKSVFDDARFGRAIDPQGCRPVVEAIVDSVLANPDMLISFARIKSAGTYTHMHAVAVSALMVALAKQLGLPPALIQEAGLAGLLHDIGKAQVPQEFLDKPARLTGQELTLLQTHAQRGHKLLAEGGKVGTGVLDMALHHHERADGSGYPDHLAADKISLFARMGAVCDIYDAVTSHRPYRAPWDPGDAMRQMAQAKGQFDVAVFQSFVKAVGIYPTGALVRLQSEQLAVVIGQGSGSLLSPKVKIFYNIEDRHRIQPFVVDLADPGRRDRITGIEQPSTWRFADLDKLWLAGPGSA